MSAQASQPDELRSVKELAEEFGMGESTVWLHIKRHGLTKYRVPLRPRLTLIRRDDFLRAVSTPVPIAGDNKGKAAA